MFFTSRPHPEKKKCSSKGGSKSNPEGPRVVISPDGVSISFSSTSKLPSNLFIQRDFSGTDKIPFLSQPAPLSNGTLSAHIQGQYAIQPGTDALLPHIWASQYGTKQASLPAPPTSSISPNSHLTGASLISTVSAAQHLAHDLQETCAAPYHSSHSACSCCSSICSYNKKTIRDRERRDSMIMGDLERRNAEEIAALKLDRDIELKVTNAIRNKEVQALIDAAASKNGGGGGDWRWDGVPHDHADRELQQQQQDSRLLLRKREGKRERERKPPSSNSSSRSATDAQLQFNLFQDLSSTGCRGSNGNSNDNINARDDAVRYSSSYMDGLQDGWWECRRRDSVVGALNRGARCLLDVSMARVESEVERLRRIERERDMERDRRGDDDWNRDWDWDWDAERRRRRRGRGRL